MLDLTGYKVVVTGGSRGIGAACCRAFAEAGASVLVHYRSGEAEARQLLKVLAGAGDPRSHTVCGADLTRPEEVDRLFEHVEETWGGLDVLVNNAGVWWKNPLSELDDGSYRTTLTLNLDAPFWCAARALPLLERSQHGSIVNIASTAGQRGEAFYSPYAASKGALISATKSWATELAPAVRVNAVAPGWVDTDMVAETLAEDRESLEAEIPLQRIATAEDIAGPVVFLASEMARHITGEVLKVNGGSVLAG